VRDHDDDETPARPPFTDAGTEPEPEPDWAEEIRRLRKARGDRLRSVFSRFDDEQEEP
jgi:hypothetical protein